MSETADQTFPVDDDLGVALLLADAADTISLARFRALDLKVSTKPDLTPVSDADLAVEDELRALLSGLRPDDAVHGEERDDSGDSARRWIIDPIDGTKNYVRGVPVWATLIALMDGPDVVTAVVSAPALGRRWWAGRNRGAWLRVLGGHATQLHVSAVAGLADASLSCSSLSGWYDLGLGEEFVALSRDIWRTRGFGDFWSYMLVAEGAVDLAAEPDLELHDMAACSLVVTEAGGRFTNLNGEDGPVGRSAVASNGLLHEAVLARFS
jgi:histidinol-phosphatase